MANRKSGIPPLGKGEQDHLLANVVGFLQNPLIFIFSIIILLVVDFLVYGSYNSNTKDLLTSIGRNFYWIVAVCYGYLFLRKKDLSHEEIKTGGEFVLALVMIIILLEVIPLIILSQFFDVTPLFYAFGALMFIIILFLAATRLGQVMKFLPAFFDSLAYGLFFLSLLGLILYHLSMVYLMFHLKMGGLLL